MKQPWDTLDIAKLLEASTDGFADQFYALSFDELTKRQKQDILRAIASQCRELAAAC